MSDFNKQTKAEILDHEIYYICLVYVNPLQRWVII